MEKLIEKYAEQLYNVEIKTGYLSMSEIEDYLRQYTLELMSSSDIDFRPIMFKRDWTTECLWYLGDRMQLEYYNNGWVTYRFGENLEILGQIPNEKKYYQVYYNDLIVLSFWNGKKFDEHDNLIRYWKEITYPK